MTKHSIPVKQWKNNPLEDNIENLGDFGFGDDFWGFPHSSVG